MNIKKSISKRKKVILLSTAVAVVLLVGIGSYLLLNKQAPSSDQSSVDYNPPTKEQKNAGDQTKEDVTSSKDQDQTTETVGGGDKKTVSVTIVDAGQYERVVEVRAFAASIAENDGTCIVEFTQGPSKVTKTTSTVVSANTTQCSPLRVATAEFPALGTWSVTVKYESSSSSGASVSQAIELK